MHRVMQRLAQPIAQPVEHRHSQNKRLASCVAAFLLLLSSPAWAEYIPPSQPSAPAGGNTTTTGRRGGCQGDEADTLTALAPVSHVGQTASVRPTFAWYVPNTPSVPLEFYLFSENGSVLYKTQLQSSPGIMSFSLPDSQSALQTGKRYRWQVVLLCNPNRPSGAIVTNAELEVVPLPADLERSLQSVTDPAIRSDRLAEAGLWYDAFTLAMQYPQLEAARRALLTSLAQVEDTEGQGDHGKQLRQIVSTVP